MKASPSDRRKMLRGIAKISWSLSVGAPVLVTDNSRIESGLMNGAIWLTLKGSLSALKVAHGMLIVRF